MDNDVDLPDAPLGGKSNIGSYSALGRKMPEIAPGLLPIFACDPRDGESPRLAAAKSLLDDCGTIVCGQVVAVFIDPAALAAQVWFYNAHREQRTALLGTEEGLALSIHVVQGFK